MRAVYPSYRVYSFLLPLALLGLAACDENNPTEDCPAFVAPDVELLDVGLVGVGKTGTSSVEILSLCQYDMFVMEVSIDHAAFSVNPPSDAIGPGGLREFTVSFSPTEQGDQTATLTLSARGGESVQIALQGRGIEWVDQDGDGFGDAAVGGDDCDDQDERVYPGATEIWYDGTDQDCDGWSDFDQDRDGYDRAIDGVGDCDDADDTVNPGVEADGNDGKDNDCDGLTDEGALSPDDLMITEVMHSPLAVADDVGEWFEVHNLGEQTVELRGFDITDGSGEGGFTIDARLDIEPGGYVVLGADRRGSTNGGVVVDFMYDRDSLKLVHTGGGLSLRVRGSEVTTVRWGDGWPAIEGRSLSLDPSASNPLQLQQRGMWCESTSALPAGDSGTPGAANDVCPRWDADNDGYSVQDGDCDDTQKAVFPGNPEVWGDGLDNDCDGLSDNLGVGTVSAGQLVGASSPYVDYLGFRDNVGLADVDGDGVAEVLLGSHFARGYKGGVYVVEAKRLLGGAGLVTSSASAIIEGASGTNQLGQIAQRSGDVTGDGKPDLVVGGTDARADGDVALSVFRGGAISGTMNPASAVFSLTGAASSVGGPAHGGLDMDGDGLCEVIYGDEAVGSRAGRVYLLHADGLSGRVPLSGADRSWDADDSYDQAGKTLGGADLDGDGYDELFVAALADDTAAKNGGAVFVLAGGRTLPASGELESRAAVVLAGALDGARLGHGAAPRAADLDGDGTLDLVIGAPSFGRVYVWLDAGSLGGTYDTDEADVTFRGASSPEEFGVGLAVGDFTGDGVHDLAIGAPDDITYNPALADDVGRVYIFDVRWAPSPGQPTRSTC